MPGSPYSRRDFFRVGSRRVAGAVGRLMERVPSPLAFGPRAPLRPPGALPEAEFRATCTACDDCVAACPKHAIRKAGPETGWGAGTPVIVPEEQACWWCEDFPCIAACEPGALLRRDGSVPPIGLAVIDRGACYAWQGQPCEYCLLRCPVEGKAISADDARRPVIDDAACVGCGVCMDRCPPDAIRIAPAGVP